MHKSHVQSLPPDLWDSLQDFARAVPDQNRGPGFESPEEVAHEPKRAAAGTLSAHESVPTRDFEPVDLETELKRTAAESEEVTGLLRGLLVGGVLDHARARQRGRKKAPVCTSMALDIPEVYVDVGDDAAETEGRTVRLVTLLDTGAGPSLINERRARAIAARLHIDIVRAQHSPHLQLGTFVASHAGLVPEWEMKLPIVFGGLRGTITVFLVEHLAVDLIMGRRSMREFGVVLDLGAGTYEVRGPVSQRRASFDQLPFRTRQMLGAVTQRKFALRTTADVPVQPLCDTTVPVEVVDTEGNSFPMALFGMTSRLTEMDDMGLLMPTLLLRTADEGPTMVHVRSLNAHGTINKGSIVGFIHPLRESETEVVAFGNPMNEARSLERDRSAALHEEARRATEEAIREDRRYERPEAQRRELEQLIGRFQGIMSPGGKPGRAQGVELAIETGDAAPVNWRSRRLSPRDEDVLRRYVDEMMDAGVIESSTSPWSAPVLVVPKKGPGEWRVAIDYRGLNRVTKPMLFPIPRMEEIWDRLHGSRYFTTLDQCAAYHAIPIRVVDQEKTAFSTPWGKFQYRTMPFGLSGAPACLGQYMSNVLGDIRGCVAYMDDLLIATPDWRSHMDVLARVFERLEQAGVKLRADKCAFARSSCEFLGHTISTEGIAPIRSKVAAMANMPAPATREGLQRALGMFNYYRRFIRGYSSIAEPLLRLLKSDDHRPNAPISLSDDAMDAFAALKTALTSEPVLVFPDFSGKLPFTLETDASNFGIGSVLVQNKHPVGYASRSLTMAERLASATEREALAVHWGCMQFRVYLAGRKFTLVTDHQPLAWILPGSETKTQHQAVRLLRWALNLQEFQFDVKYRPGKQLILPDGLSRLPENGDEAAQVARMKALAGLPNSSRELQETERVFAKKAKETLTHLHKLQQGWADPTGLDDDAGKEPSAEAHSDRELVAFTAEQQTEEFARVIEGMDEAHTPTRAEFEQAQKEDLFCSGLKHFVGTGRVPPVGPTALQRQIERFGPLCWVSPSGLVYRSMDEHEEPPYKTHVQVPDVLDAMRVVVPEGLQKRVMGALHDSQFAAHMGVMKTLRRVNMRFWWPSVREDVIRYVGECSLCSVVKAGRRRARVHLNPYVASYPMHIVHVDLVAGLPEVDGYKYILVIVDKFTKWVELVPLRSKDASEMQQALTANLLCRFGLPTQIVADRGTEFEGELAATCRALRVKFVRTAPYHPQANAQVERTNGSLKVGLRTLCAGRERKWKDLLPWWGFAFRSAVHTATGFSPYALMMGREPLFPIDVLNRDPALEQELTNPLADPAGVQKHLAKVLSEAWELAWRTNVAAARDNKAYFDQRAACAEYKVDALVWVFRPSRSVANQPKKKLRLGWHGPYKVVAKLAPYTYRVKWANDRVQMTDRQWRELTVHVRNMYHAAWPPQWELQRAVVAEPAVDEKKAAPARAAGPIPPSPVEQPKAPEASQGRIDREEVQAPRAAPEVPVVPHDHQGERDRMHPVQVGAETKNELRGADRESVLASEVPDPLPELAPLVEEQWARVTSIDLNVPGDSALRVSVILRNGKRSQTVFQSPEALQAMDGVAAAEQAVRMRLLQAFRDAAARPRRRGEHTNYALLHGERPMMKRAASESARRDGKRPRKRG